MDENIKLKAGCWHKYLCRKLEDIIFAETPEELTAAQYYYASAIKRMYMRGYPIEVLEHYGRLYSKAERILASRDSRELN